MTTSTTPRHVVVQLSDLHIVPENDLLHDRVDTTANVTAALAAIESADIRPAAILLTGDLADTGDPAAYRRLRTVAEEAAARIGAPVLYGMGNHDTWSTFRSDLLADDTVEAPYDHVTWVDGLRIVMMDTTEHGHHHGILTADQLAWLREELATPAPDGTVLAFHHPPLLSPIPLVNGLLLRNPDELAKVVAGTDVRIILCGHSHHASAGVLAGIPVWVAGATAYDADVLAPGGGMRGVVGGAYTRIDVYDGEAVATSVPVHTGETVYELSVEQLNRFMSMTPEEREAAQAEHEAQRAGAAAETAGV